MRKCADFEKTVAISGRACYYITCVTARYAMKLKVAGGMPGNFSRVCPILNRATVIANTVCAFDSLRAGSENLQVKAQSRYVHVKSSEKRQKFFGFFVRRRETHGGVCEVFGKTEKVGEGSRPAPNKKKPRRRFKWQSMKK